MGIGDDAAVLDGGRAIRRPGDLLFATDLLIEGRHFSCAWSRPEEVAEKALASNASDVAAMGGRPLGAVLGLGAPPDVTLAWLDAFARGLARAGRALGVPVVGGDTVRAPLIVVAGAIVGRTGPRGALRRGGARPGDVLCVTGDLGAAATGLALLASAGSSALLAETRRRGLTRRFGRAVPHVLRRQLRGVARLAEGERLAAAGAHALIDVSDGLASEAWHVARASGVRVVLDAAAIPMRPDVRALAARLGRDPAALALAGGEDYELLAALPPRAVAGARARLERARLASLTEVGTVERGRPAVVLRSARGERPLPPLGFDHFREGPHASDHALRRPRD